MPPNNSRIGPPNQYDTAYLGMGGWGSPTVPGSLGSGTFSLDTPQTPLGSYGLPQVSNAASPASPAAAAGGNSWFDSLQKWSGTKDAPGPGGMLLGAAGGIANAYFGMQQLDLAKQTLDQNKKQFELNYGAQRSTTNTNLRDRQAARVASNSGAYQSVGDYMNQNGIA